KGERGSGSERPFTFHVSPQSPLTPPLRYAQGDSPPLLYEDCTPIPKGHPMQRNASARWTGDLKNGQGTLAVGSGAFSGPYSFVSRFEGSGDTNPEELLGAAHAACYSMALSLACSTAGHVPTSVETKAVVHLEKLEAGMTITRI